MLRVTVEVIPFGDEDQSRKIGEMIIANDGTLGAGLASYKAVQKIEGWEPQFKEDIVHKRADGFWELIYLVLDEPPFNGGDKELASRLKM